MVHRNAFLSTLVTLALFGAGPAWADPMSFSGSVANDFSLVPTPNNGENTVKSTNSNVVVVNVDSHPLDMIAQLPEMTNQGIINGYAIKDIAFYYDSKADKLYVGLDTYSIAGSAVGSGGAAMDAILTQKGFQDPAHLGGDKSITVGFAGNNPGDNNQPGSMVFVAGVPSDKSAGNPSALDGFTVAKYAGMSNQGLQNNYGAAVTGSQGTLAFDPSASHPNFEFSISNFSKISSSVDPTQGFWIRAYAGSAQDGPIGEENTALIRIPKLAPQTIPEPTTWLAWTLVAGSAAYRLRRRGKK
jgi:hypothetical protein